MNEIIFYKTRTEAEKKCGPGQIVKSMGNAIRRYYVKTEDQCDVAERNVEYAKWDKEYPVSNRVRPY